ncbi:MAG: short-chain dehydrogenase, partial [Pseudomonas sp.]|nr:short-chain dehydrogenase [Pseudomonas sp.]
MSTGKLAGRVAIITGSGGGLGAECARVLASHGASIAVVDINFEGATAVAQSLLAEGHQALAIATDVSSEDAVRAMVAQVKQHFGRIDILHNNAAILNAEQRQLDRDFVNLDMQAWDRAIAVNLRGAVLCTKHVIPVML